MRNPPWDRPASALDEHEDAVTDGNEARVDGVVDRIITEEGPQFVSRRVAFRGLSDKSAAEHMGDGDDATRASEVE